MTVVILDLFFKRAGTLYFHPCSIIAYYATCFMYCSNHVLELCELNLLAFLYSYWNYACIFRMVLCTALLNSYVLVMAHYKLININYKNQQIFMQLLPQNELN